MVEKKESNSAERDERKGQRRRYLSEDEFRKLLEEGKVTPDDRRRWEERRND
jgi:hypothetical protein